MRCLRSSDARSFAGGKEFDPSSFGEWPCPHGVEHLKGAAELVASLASSFLTPEPFPVEKMGPRHFGEQERLIEVIQCLGKKRCGPGIIGQQCTRACKQTESPRCA